jgi:hypothetical protein
VTAVALAGVLGALVVVDAGQAVGIVLTLAALSELSLVLALVTGWSPGVLAALALLAPAFLARQGDPLALAPLFAGGLLLFGELAQQSIELRGVQRLEDGVVTSRVAHVLGIAGLGAAAGAVATIAVRYAPSHAVGVTAVGAVAVVGAVAGLSWLARRAAGSPS